MNIISSKILWAASGGLCAFPECNQELICRTTNDIIGQICHIIAQKPAGPRGDINFPKERLDEYDNLILLCPTHHMIVDKDTKTYTVEKLQKMKKEHEEHMYRLLCSGSEWTPNISQLYYINVPRLSMLAATKLENIDLTYFDKFKCLHDMNYELSYVMQEFKELLNKITINVFSLDADISKLKVGQCIEFNGKFRTKNIPAPNLVSGGKYQMQGDLEKDPHVYYKNGNYKLILTIDPRWITTTTSFVNLSNGWIDISGVAIIKQIIGDKVIASPYIFGIPKTPFDDLFSSTERSISF